MREQKYPLHREKANFAKNTNLMQAGIAYLRKELKDHYPAEEIEGLIRFIFRVWKRYDTRELLLRKQEVLNPADRSLLHSVVHRLKRHEPIQYILGETEFFGLPFRLSPDVLIPRPETEELVDWVIRSGPAPGSSVLDVGTGSGCIAVSLKQKLPAMHVFGCDISEKALQIARQNAEINRLPVTFFLMDILHPAPDSGPFDLIVSNPPYVTRKEIQQMQQNVTDYEPHAALFVPDDDPLRFYRALLSFGQSHLHPGGRQFWEINEAFGMKCMELMTKSGYREVELKKDINGKDRMISGRYPGSY